MPEQPTNPLSSSASINDTAPHSPTNGDEAGPLSGAGAIRYELGEEIGRGGMGAVLKGRDVHLGRDVALKVLREDHRDNPALARRFLDEAQIAGQLQHPGVVPIHELGTLPDGRPFFAMKLVKGDTLAELLKSRPTPADDRPLFLKVFEQVCQAMAYAHSKGVIHRDLKPANVMVGAFGEVQVMDWGLAKVLPSGGRQPPEFPHDRHGTVIKTGRSSDPGFQTQAGSALGTYAYMPPEQAAGRVGELDRRCDVFGLGAILCEILTGQPPYAGPTVEAVKYQALQGDVAGTFARLDGCEADPELIALAKQCLAAKPADRPADADGVAQAMAGYLASVQERVRQAELTAARAQERATSERKRRRLTLLLSLAVLAAVGLGGLAWWWSWALQMKMEQVARAAVQEAESLADQGRHEEALAAADRAEGFLGHRAVSANVCDWGQGVLAGLRDRVTADRRDRRLLDRLSTIRLARGDEFTPQATDKAYAAVFRECGIDVSANLSAAVAQVRAQSPAVTAALTATLDDWAGVRRFLGRPRSQWSGLLALAMAADPDPLRNKVRGFQLVDRSAGQLDDLHELARRAKGQPVPTVLLLADELIRAGDGPAAEALLRQALRTHPGDLWLNYRLGYFLFRQRRPPAVDEAIGYFLVVRAQRPEIGHQLAHAYQTSGQSGPTLELFREIIGRQPNVAQHYFCYAGELLRAGRPADAEAVVRKALELQPEFADAWRLLGTALSLLGRDKEAVAAFHRAGAPERWVTALDFVFEPQRSRLKFDGLVTAYRRLAEAWPDRAEIQVKLSWLLIQQWHWPEAVAASREAIRLNPRAAPAYTNLGWALWNEGLAHRDPRLLRAALAPLQEAVRLDPVGSEAQPSLKTVSRWQRTDRALPALLIFGVADVRDRLELARACDLRWLHQTAARLYRSAFAANPVLAEDVLSGNDVEVFFKDSDRAAYAAVLAAAGQGKDAADLTPTERAQWRRQALIWLRAELSRWSTRIAVGGPTDRSMAINQLAVWQSSADLVSVHAPARLTQLPLGERRQWEQLWADVAALRERARRER